MERRELFPILMAAVAADADAQHEHHKPAVVSTDAYRRRVFDERQNATLSTLADIIIPASDGSGGAAEARVSQYFDLVASQVPPMKEAFFTGLLEFDALALKLEGRKLNELDRAGLTRLLTEAARQEGAPTDGAGRFFELLKLHTVEGYRMSHIGQMQWIGYKPHPVGLYPDLTVD